MFNTSGVSLADIAAVTGNGNNCNGWGADGGIWVLIILFALFGGWGDRNGERNNGNGGGGPVYIQNPVGSCTNSSVAAEVQRGFDTSAIISKLDGINSGICSLGYDQLNQMNGINMSIAQTGFGIQQAINADTVAGMQNANALSTQIAQCCCENRQGQAELRYTMAQDTCAITTAINQAAQNIMQNDNANYRQLHDEQVQLQIEGYKQRIAEQNALINSLNLQASQAAQTMNIIDAVRPTPQPSYTVPNPYTGCCGNNYGNNYNNNACGCSGNNCCGF